MRSASFSPSLRALWHALGMLALLVLTAPHAAAIDDASPHRVKFTTKGLGLIGDGPVGEEGDEVSAGANEKEAGVCWTFYSTPGRAHIVIGPDATSPSVVAYFPLPGEGGEGEMPLASMLPAPLNQWGIGRQQAGVSPSC